MKRGPGVVLERQEGHNVVPELLHDKAIQHRAAARGILVVKRHDRQLFLRQERHCRSSAPVAARSVQIYAPSTVHW